MPIEAIFGFGLAFFLWTFKMDGPSRGNSNGGQQLSREQIEMLQRQNRR